MAANFGIIGCDYVGSRQHFSSEAADVLLPEQPQHLSVSLNFVILSITRVFSAQEIRDPIQVFLNLWMVF